ncbi:MAG: hypothetical protein LAO19_16430 [Acidobacteriia bacterium]|nr:hypothetical protein [Terriglobia bacterium]
MLRLLIFAWLVLASTTARAQTWKPLGPPGGDVRTLAADSSHPGHVFLGTADGHIFGSEDSGAHWALLGRASDRLDAVITAIVVDRRDSQVLYASSWTRDSSAGGGVFRSADGGKSWTAAGLAGQAVRALAAAPSDPNVLVAGTLDGVYRSPDGARSWERISPEHHAELRNLDSVAIDPRDPGVIYAGTFHLPWKTADGGRTWRPIHEGMIDDSDVMSLLIDGPHPERVYASACSGIYRSDDGAAQWRKIQGIPYAARRTYAIVEDPANPDHVYAATSEGLWKTDDAGKNWRRTTPESWVVNAVAVDAGRPGRVLIGTEEFGVLASEDSGEHFQEANNGFFHRQILALAADDAHQGRLLAVLAHAPEPVLVTDDDGQSWNPLGPGLQARDVLRVYASPQGWWASLSGGGLMKYDVQQATWRSAGLVTGEATNATETSLPHSRGSARNRKEGPQVLRQIVNDMAFSSNAWYAATNAGLYLSLDRGKTWALKPIGPLTTLPVQSVRVSSNGEKLWVVSLRGLVFSVDAGKSWSWHDLPLDSGGAVSLNMDPDDQTTMISRARSGLYISSDAGNTWRQAGAGLPSTPVQDFAASGDVFLASMRTGGLYASSDAGRTWARLAGTLGEGFFPSVLWEGHADVIFAASATEGLYAVRWSSFAAGGREGGNDAARPKLSRNVPN